jgi:hypothetical protein
MTVHHLHAGDPADPLTEIRTLLGNIPVEKFCELAAQMFHATEGDQTLEMNFRDGTFRWVRVHSGPIGADEAQRRYGN